MSRLISRILLAIFLIPLASLLYITIYVIVEHLFGYGNWMTCFIVAGLGTWSFVVCYWVFLWSSAVRWTGSRVSLTTVAALGALVIGVAVGTMLELLESHVGVFIGSVLAPVVWLVATIPLWRETAAGRAARLKNFSYQAIVCPNCGYNLTGLREARCPECGSQFTLDELLTAQSVSDGGELEG